MGKTVAIVLAAGRGKRMQSDVAKQYLLIKGKPVLFYSLKAFEDSVVDEIILVTAESEITYCKKEIVEKYNFNKVSRIVAGGKERYHSVARSYVTNYIESHVFTEEILKGFSHPANELIIPKMKSMIESVKYHYTGEKNVK